MDKLKQFIVLFVLFINTQFINGQQTITVDETVFIHANSTTFVSGETLLYKLYCLKSSDKTLSGISKIAYVQLIDNNNKNIFKTKIFLENSIGQGDYFIPTSLKTGTYKLIAYTNWTLNKPISDLFQLNINIINPYKQIDKTSSENILSGNSNSFNENKSGNLNDKDIIIKLNKKTFTNRELVDLKISTLDKKLENGVYSLSVRKLDKIPTQDQISAIEFASKTSSPLIIDLQKNNQNIILPELRGEMITGKIIAKNSIDEIENIPVSISIPGKYFKFDIVKTDKNGNFIFNVSKQFYSSNIIIQIVDEKANNYDIQINNAPEIELNKISFEQNSKLSYNIKESLSERLISSQIENAYYHKKVDKLEKNQVIEPFYFPLAKEYILDDYTRFKTLKETITEVVTEVFSKQKDGNLYLHVNDPSIFPQFPDPALVLVDGLYLANQNDLLTYNMKNVYKIDVIIGRYYVGPKSFNGLISLTTFDNDFKSTQSGSSILKPSILRPEPKKIYNKIKYENHNDDRIPDFRNQLFWNPNVQLNNESETSFYTSDLSGTFEIRLEGFTQKGTPVSLKENIEVQN